MAVDDGDILRITARMQLFNTDAVQNVYHVKHNSGSSKSEEDFGDHILEWMEALYECINAQVTDYLDYIDCQIYNITQDVPLDPVAFTDPTEGDLDTGMTASGTSFLITLGTAKKNTSGRKYFGGMCKANLTLNGQWATTLITLGACVILKLLGNQVYNAVSSVPGVYNYTTLAFEDFNEGVVQLVPAYQRRRREGEGA